MADQQEGRPGDEDLRLAYFPPPPPFFHHFTTENLERLKDIDKEAGIDSENEDKTSTQLSADQVLALPTELRYLVPPPPPAATSDIKVFGELSSASGTDTFNQKMEWISRTLVREKVLEDWSYTQLYPPLSVSSDAQRYLFRFLRSILIAYIELLGIVAVNPTAEQKDEKLRDILTMVVNMHSLVNEYRPHQARETLIREMERQVSRKKAEVEGVRKMRVRVEEVLEGFGKEGDKKEERKGSDRVVPDGAHGRIEKDKRREMQREMWVALDEMLG